MKHSLQLRLSQHLTLTPQLQQSIRLLQLSTLELNQEIEKILQDNPLLEREDGFHEDQLGATPPPGSSAEISSSPTSSSAESAAGDSDSGNSDSGSNDSGEANSFDEAFSYSSGAAHDDNDE